MQNDKVISSCFPHITMHRCVRLTYAYWAFTIHNSQSLTARAQHLTADPHPAWHRPNSSQMEAWPRRSPSHPSCPASTAGHGMRAVAGRSAMGPSQRRAADILKYWCAFGEAKHKSAVL